jgi:uncharacterized protein (DUF305 family)
MRKTLATTASCTFALLLASCGGSTEENASDNLAANVAAHDMNMLADADNPFHQSEMTMNERMMSAVGTDVGDTWVRKMIEHHQGAIDMSRIMLQQSPPADVAKVAQETITKQEKEIADLRKLMTEGSSNPQSAEPYKIAEKQMHDAMMAAKGSGVAETFMRKMLEHHKGGVALSDAALNNGVTGQVHAHAQRTKENQQNEAEMVEAMLGGQSHAQAMAASGVKSAEQAKAESTVPAKAATTSKVKASSPAPTPSASSEPKAASVPSKPQPKAATPTCLPEHRALGHC